MEDRYFGPPDVQAMSRRASALFRLVHDDPSMAWYGRFVALASYRDGGVERHIDLVRTQGASPAYWIPVAAAGEAESGLVDAGLKADRFEYVVTEGHSTRRARDILDAHGLDDDLDIIRLQSDSPDGDLDDFAAVAVAAGVLPPPASVLRGQARKGVFYLARERQSGAPVSCAASIETFHPKAEAHDHAFWGMLSTVPEKRGRKIALILGAKAMIAMEEDFGIAKFTTGVRAENVGSMALCEKLDMRPGKWCTFVGMDPSQFSGDRVTK